MGDVWAVEQVVWEASLVAALRCGAEYPFQRRKVAGIDIPADDTDVTDERKFPSRSRVVWLRRGQLLSRLGNDTRYEDVRNG